MSGLEADPIAATTVILSWLPLPDNQTYGDLYGYVVRVSLLSATNSIATCLQENDTVLDHNTTFSVKNSTLQVENIGELAIMYTRVLYNNISYKWV